MRFLRRARTSRKLTDYRQAAQKVIERRYSREAVEFPAVRVEAPAERYAPPERLRAIEKRVADLVSDAEFIPRKWEPETADPQLNILKRVNFMIAGSFVCTSLGFILICAAMYWPSVGLNEALQLYGLITLLVLGTYAGWKSMALSDQIQDGGQWHPWFTRGAIVFGILAWLFAAIAILEALIRDS
jgi:hypothetical protein